MAQPEAHVCERAKLFRLDRDEGRSKAKDWGLGRQKLGSIRKEPGPAPVRSQAFRRSRKLPKLSRFLTPAGVAFPRFPLRLACPLACLEVTHPGARFRRLESSMPMFRRDPALKYCCSDISHARLVVMNAFLLPRTLRHSIVTTYPAAGKDRLSGRSATVVLL